MSKSRKRGGQKAHNKRIQKRNVLMKSHQKKIQKMFQDEMMSTIEKMKNSMSGETNQENVNDGGFVQPSQNV